MAMLLISLAESFGQKSVTITPNCNTNTLTITGTFNGQATSRCNGLVFKDNQVIASTGELQGPTINKSVPLSGSGTYWVKLMEINNDNNNVSSPALAVNCSGGNTNGGTTSDSNTGGTTQTGVTITPNCNTNTLTITGTFNGQVTNRCNGLVFKDNQVIASTGELQGPTINKSVPLSGSGTYWVKLMEINNDNNNVSSPALAVNCSVVITTNPPVTNPLTQTGVTITPNCNTNTLTITGTFNGQVTNRCNGLIFKDNQVIASTGELQGPTINKSVPLSGSGTYWVKLMEVSNDNNNVSSPALAVNCSVVITTNPPVTNSLTQAGSNLTGNLDFVDCGGISGWALNKDTPGKSTKLDIYINGWLAATGVPVTQSRQDVANAYGIAGYTNFGFNINIPKKYKAGFPLTVSVKYAGTSTHIPGSPKTTVPCENVQLYNINPECQTGIARVFQEGDQAISVGVAHTGTIALKLSAKGSGSLSSLTSKLIPVKQGNTLLLDAYSFTQGLPKHSLAPQVTSAAIGGVLAGLSLSQQKGTGPDQRHTNSVAPALGVSTALMIPLVKSLVANRLPNAGIELAFYNQKGQFVHRQQVRIDRTARDNWQLLHLEGHAPQDEYAQIRLYNQSKTAVWFDDLQFESVPDPSKNKAQPAPGLPKLTSSPGGFPTQLSTANQNIIQAAQSTPCPSHTGGAIVVDDWPGVWLDIDVTVTATATGSVPTPSTGSGGSTYTEDGENYLIPKGAPNKPSVGTTYVSSSGVIYIWDRKYWCVQIDPADVKGERPANPSDKEYYMYTNSQFGYSILYEYIDGHWTMPLNSSIDDPIKIKNLPNKIDKQVGPNLCVPTVMRFLLQYFCNGGDVDINSINNYYHDISGNWAVLQGVDVGDMNKLVGHYFNIGNFSTVSDALKAGQPTMVAIPTDDPNTLHNVLVTGYNPNTSQYTYLDPIPGGEVVTSLAVIDNSPYKYSVSCK